MPDEIWKDIKDYEGLYQISNYGNVKSLPKERHNRRGVYIQKEKLLSLTNTSTGYKKVELVKDGKRKGFKVHRLVAQAFIPNPDEKPQVNHIDGDKTNNYVDNLEWATASENSIHAYNTGLNSRKRELNESEIIYMYCELNMTMQEISKHFGVSIPTIRKRLEDNNIDIKTIGELQNKFYLDDLNLEELLKTKTQVQLAKELGCSPSLISKKINNKNNN